MPRRRWPTRSGFYSLLAQYPAFTFSASVATITGLLFYVTSAADSGALVLGNFTEAEGHQQRRPELAAHLLVGGHRSVDLGMLMTNGISALQNTTVIMGLPFSFVIFFVMAGLYKSLKVEDYRRVSASRDTAPAARWASRIAELKKRLSRLMNYPGTRYTKLMMETVCYPAMEEVAQELRLAGAAVELKSLPPEEVRTLATSICWCTWATSRTLSTRSGRSSTRCRLYLSGARMREITYTGWRPSCWRAVRVTT
ncbi:BCCT family transporter [Klebsiella pneumoniae]|nr:BCCT family transporter [Klebsiella pneumoniae]